jgi:redox-sensitive bicupin YhaK (pirin superfamily)
MKRNKFLKKSLFGIFAGLSFSSLSKSKIKRNIGFNHMPNLENTSVNTVIHRANTRNSADFGWLKVNHTFSFANYYNPERMNFGVLRVLNDDVIAAGKGFDTHPHKNMEIITIPLEGKLRHKDDMGNEGIISDTDIQVMSAGKGVYHSEFNADENKEVKVLQIWLHPNKTHVEPRYQQISLNDIYIKNDFFQILSPEKNDQGVWIHQNSWFYIGDFNLLKNINYTIKDAKNGVYCFVIEGEATLDGNKLSRRDAIGIWNTNSVNISTTNGTKLLLMEVPMQV